jgi:pentatricopeptide repeat protein
MMIARLFFATRAGVARTVPSQKTVKKKLIANEELNNSNSRTAIANTETTSIAKKKKKRDADAEDDNDSDFGFMAQTAEDFEFRDAYKSPSDYMRARLTYDLLTLPIRSPMRRDSRLDAFASSSLLPTVPVNEAEFWAKHGGSPSPAAYNQLIAIHAQRDDFSNALRVFLDADRAGMINVRHFTTLLRVCPTLALADEHVLRRVASLEKPELDTHFFSALLYVHRRERSVGYEVLGMMEKAGVAPDGVIYTDLIRNATKLQRYNDCWRLYHEMRHRDISPDEVVYTHMIYVAGKRQETERAIGLYEEMINQNMHPTDVTYDALIRACAARYDYAEEAVLMFERMRAAGFAPTTVTYCAVMTAMSHRNDRDAIESVYEQAVHENGDQPTVQLDARLLFAYGRQCEVGGRNDASEMYQNAIGILKYYQDRASGELPEQMVDAFLTFLARACFIDRARKFFDLHPMTKQRVTTMLQMYCETRRADDAVALAQKALALKMLDGDGLTAALAACARVYYAKSGTALWLDAAHTGVLPDAETDGVRKFLALLKSIQREDDITKLMPLTSRNPRTVPRTYFQHEKGTAYRARKMNRKLPADIVREQGLANDSAHHY